MPLRMKFTAPSIPLGEYRAAAFPRQHFPVILDALPRLDNGVKGYDNQPPPCAVISRTDAGEVVGKENQRVGLLHLFRLPVFFFNSHLVGTCHLLERCHGQPLVFFQFPGDNQTFPPQRCQSRALVRFVGGEGLNINAMPPE